MEFWDVEVKPGQQLRIDLSDKKQEGENTYEEDNKKSTPETDDSEEDENVNGGSDKSEDEKCEDTEEEKGKKRERSSNKSSSKKNSSVKPKAKEVAAAKPSKSGLKVKDQTDDGPKEKTCGEKAVKEKEEPKSEKHQISDDDLRAAVCEILKEIDINTATFNDVLKQLAERFSTNLTSRKTSIKFLIQKELTKLSDEANKEDEDEYEK